MEIKDQALVYKSLLQDTKSAIRDIGTLGFDTKPYYDTLDNIVDSVEQNVSGREGGTAAMFLTMDYATGIKHLTKLYRILEKQNIYFKIFNICKLLEMKLEQNLSKEEISECANQVIDMLDSLRYSETTRYQDEQKIVEKAFSLAYQLIKMEILSFGESKIYNVSKEHEIDCSFFNECITDDIESLDLTDEKHRTLQTRLYEIKSKGIGSSYFDINIIKAIVALNPNSNLVEGIKNNIGNLEREIEKSDKRIASLYEVYCEKNRILERWQHKKKSFAKDVAKSISSIILSLAFYISSFAALTALARKITKDTVYNEERTSYSKEYGKETGIREYKTPSQMNQPQDGVYIKSYGNWVPGDYSDGVDDGELYRKVKVYDMSGFDFETLKEYLTVALANLDYTEETEIGKDVDKSELARDAYISVQDLSYENMGEVQGNSWVLFTFIFLLLDGFVISTVEIYKSKKYKDIAGKMTDLSFDVQELKSAKKTTKERYESLKSTVQELLDYIDQNDELKAKLNEEIKNNEALLSLLGETTGYKKPEFKSNDVMRRTLTKRGNHN